MRNRRMHDETLVAEQGRQVRHKLPRCGASSQCGGRIFSSFQPLDRLKLQPERYHSTRRGEDRSVVHPGGRILIPLSIHAVL